MHTKQSGISGISFTIDTTRQYFLDRKLLELDLSVLEYFCNKTDSYK